MMSIALEQEKQLEITLYHWYYAADAKHFYYGANFSSSCPESDIEDHPFHFQNGPLLALNMMTQNELDHILVIVYHCLGIHGVPLKYEMANGADWYDYSQRPNDFYSLIRFDEEISDAAFPDFLRLSKQLLIGLCYDARLIQMMKNGQNGKTEQWMKTLFGTPLTLHPPAQKNTANIIKELNRTAKSTSETDLALLQLLLPSVLWWQQNFDVYPKEVKKETFLVKQKGLLLQPYPFPELGIGIRRAKNTVADDKLSFSESALHLSMFCRIEYAKYIKEHPQKKRSEIDELNALVKGLLQKEMYSLNPDSLKEHFKTNTAGSMYEALVENLPHASLRSYEITNRYKITSKGASVKDPNVKIATYQLSAGAERQIPFCHNPFERLLLFYGEEYIGMKNISCFISEDEIELIGDRLLRKNLRIWNRNPYFDAMQKLLKQSYCTSEDHQLKIPWVEGLNWLTVENLTGAVSALAFYGKSSVLSSLYGVYGKMALSLIRHLHILEVINKPPSLDSIRYTFFHSPEHELFFGYFLMDHFDEIATENTIQVINQFLERASAITFDQNMEFDTICYFEKALKPVVERFAELMDEPEPEIW